MLGNSNLALQAISGYSEIMSKEMKASNKKHLVMIVEDDQDSREAIVAVVQSLGYETAAFESAVEALKKIDSLKISVALIDIMMPVMNGLELMQAIRNKPELTGLPIILVTARAEDDDMLEGYKFGADYYIPKPFTAKQIEYGLKLFLSSAS